MTFALKLVRRYRPASMVGIIGRGSGRDGRKGGKCSMLKEHETRFITSVVNFIVACLIRMRAQPPLILIARKSAA